ncbi:MAG: tetratricopeptide repeat protein [Methylacidiphilales bacterium]|nr:tetratricopeptide repeat protein [Candidatus Methylacidiphilales bacterium]
MVKPLLKLKSAILLTACLALLCVNQVRGEDATSSAKSAFESFQAGKMDEAAQKLTQLIQQYPTSFEVPNARYLLGVIDCLLGKYSDAIPYLSDSKNFDKATIPQAAYYLGIAYYGAGDYNKASEALDKAYTALTDPKTAITAESKELAPYALFYYAQAKLGFAAKNFATQEAAAVKAVDDGSAKIKELTDKFPDSDIVTDALMAKSSMLGVIGKYAEAVQILEALTKRKGIEDMAEDIDFALGHMLTLQYNKLREDFKYDEAAEIIERAQQTYEHLSKSENLVLANRAAFELANLNFDLATLAPAESRTDAFMKAIDSYRHLSSKSDIEANQKQRIEEIRQKIGGAAGNKAQVNTLTRSLQREQQKLAEVQQNPDQATDALLQIGLCYMQLRKYDEARVVLRHAQQFARKDQQKQLTVQLIITYALQGQSSAAEKHFAEFKQKFPNDPETKNVPYFLGIALKQQEKYEDALKRFDDFLKDAPPNSPYVVRVPQEKAGILIALKRTDEAIKAFDDFLKDAETGKIKISPEETENARHLRAIALLQGNKIPEGLAAMQDLSKNAKNSRLREDAAFQVPNILFNAKKPDEAFAEYQNFLKAYPQSDNAPKAAYYMAACLKSQKKIPEALEAYAAFIKNYNNDDLKLKAHEQIWGIYQSSNEYEKMVEAQNKQMAAFPNSERNLYAYYQRARYLEEVSKKPDESVEAYLKVVEAFNALPASMREGEAGRKNSIYPTTALLHCFDIYRKQAVHLGNPLILKGAELEAWKTSIEKAYRYCDRLLQEYGMALYTSAQPGQVNSLGTTLQRMTELQLLRVKGKLTSAGDATTYFSKLAGSLNDDGAVALVMIARAGFVYQAGDTEQALSFYRDIFGKFSDPKNENASDPKKIAWQEYDRYGSLLLDNKDWDTALKIYQVLKDAFPDVLRAQASAVYGLGASYTGKGELAKAEDLFKELGEKYKWSEKILDANFNRGLAQREKGNYAEAFKIWKDVMANQRSTNVDEVKARTMVEFGKTLKLMADKNLTTSETKLPDGKEIPIYELAANYCLKAYLFYANQSDVVPEGLYTAIQIYTTKLQKFQNSDKNPKTEARALFDKMSESYSTSPWTSKAQELLR